MSSRDSVHWRHCHVMSQEGREISVSINISIRSFLAYGRREGNLNWPIRIQQAGKKLTVLTSIVSWQERHWNQATFLIGDGMKYSRKGIYNSQNHITLQKVKNMKHFVSPTSNVTPKMVVPRASPGRIIVVLFLTKYAVRRQIKSGIL